jgi:hypothetical protein
MIKLKFILSLFIVFAFTGCATIPTGFLKPPDEYMQKRQLQMRYYETTDEEKIITSVAGVLQDLGFTLDDSETEVGLVAASKKADATDGGQIAAAFFIDFLSALGGNHSNASSQVDAVQHVKASVIVKPSLEGNRIVVRVTFQRIVWNVSNQINKVETVDDPEIYQKFFENLSKSIFLEAHKI